MDNRKPEDMTPLAFDELPPHLKRRIAGSKLARQWEAAAGDQAQPTGSEQPETPDGLKPPTVIGPDGEPVLAALLTLGIEKFSFPGEKHYRLIWARRGEAWLAEEDTTRFKRKRDAVEAGRKLAGRFKLLYFSEVAR